MKPNNPPRIAVLLVNLGTPDEPTAPAVRRYLRQFLSDPRVIEIPQVLWAIILNLFVLPFRPKRVAEAYASIWEGDSPIRRILTEQVTGLQSALDNDNVGTGVGIGTGGADSSFSVTVHAAMTYGSPAVTDVLGKLSSEGVEHMVLLPMFPQYSATSGGAVYDAVTGWLQKQRNLPSISIIKDYFAHPLYIEALADSVRSFQAAHGRAEKLLFSFHGIPKPYEDKGDPYARRCRCTAAQVAHKLGLGSDEWLCAFQSRFGKQEWVKPYTDEVLAEWGAQGVASVQVLSPAFSADCLETLEELAVENKHNFQSAGGGEYAYIPALNSQDAHIDLIKTLVTPHIKAWQDNLKAWV